MDYIRLECLEIIIVPPETDGKILTCHNAYVYVLLVFTRNGRTLQLSKCRNLNKAKIKNLTFIWGAQLHTVHTHELVYTETVRSFLLARPGNKRLQNECDGFGPAFKRSTIVLFLYIPKESGLQVSRGRDEWWLIGKTNGKKNVNLRTGAGTCLRREENNMTDCGIHTMTRIIILFKW